MDTREIVYQALVAAASCEKTVSYDEIAVMAGLKAEKREDRAHLVQILEDIAYSENARGHPLLTAVVVRPEIRYPGAGFFILARELGFNSFEDDRSYYEYELRRVYAFWKQHIPVFQTQAYMVANGFDIRVG